MLKASITSHRGTGCDTLLAEGMLGLVVLQSKNASRLEEASGILTSALEKATVQLGAGHPETFKMTMFLAHVMLNVGAFSESYALARRAVFQCLHLHGSENEVTSTLCVHFCIGCQHYLSCEEVIEAAPAYHAYCTGANVACCFW
jgi:hypothetical protein